MHLVAMMFSPLRELKEHRRTFQKALTRRCNGLRPIEGTEMWNAFLKHHLPQCCRDVTPIKGTESTCSQLDTNDIIGL